MHRTVSLPALALALVPLGNPSDVTVYESLPGGGGDVRILDESGVLPERRPVELQGITLLDVDYVGRTTLRERLGEGGRRLTLPGGAARVELPQYRGTIYHYRRGTGAEAAFGWFQVDPAGTARPLHELPGLGLDGLTDPYSPRLGLDTAGTHVLVGTVLAAGGDVLEVDLQNDTVENRSDNRPPLDLTINGLALLPSFGVALTPKGPWRFDRTPGGRLVRVPFAREALAGVTGSQSNTTIFSPDLVCSQDGSTLAVSAGPTPDMLHLYVFGAAGMARRVTQTPARITGGGFLPEFASGPTMALSPDGANVAWRVDFGAFRDIHVRSTAVANAAVPTFEITADANFTDTLDDSGVIAFYSPTDLMMVVGEGNPNGVIDRGDVYVVRDVAAPAPAIVNVTGTSGDLGAPYLEAGRFGTDDGVEILPDGSGALALVRYESGDKHVELLDFATGQTTRQVSFVDRMELLTASQGYVAFSLFRDSGRHELYHLAPGAPSATRLYSAMGTTFRLWTTDGQGNFGAILSSLSGEFLGRIHLPTLNSTVAINQPLTFGPTFGFLQDDALALSITTPGNDFPIVWTHQGAGNLLPTGSMKGFVLP